jgi:hypothetical protein
MAKQSKTARADSSAGQSAAEVSSNTDAVAVAEPRNAQGAGCSDGHGLRWPTKSRRCRNSYDGRWRIKR